MSVICSAPYSNAGLISAVIAGASACIRLRNLPRFWILGIRFAGDGKKRDEFAIPLHVLDSSDRVYARRCDTPAPEARR